MEPAGFRFCRNLWDGQVNPSRRSAPSLDAPQVGYLAAVGFSRSAQAASVSEAQHLELENGGTSIRGRSDPVAQRLNERGEDRFLLTSGATTAEATSAHPPALHRAVRPGTLVLGLQRAGISSSSKRAGKRRWPLSARRRARHKYLNERRREARALTRRAKSAP